MTDYLKKQKTNPEVITQLFSDKQNGNENWCLLMRVELQKISPDIPKEWIEDIEFGIQHILENPETTCTRCGRRLIDKFLAAIWETDYQNRTYTDRNRSKALEELKDRADDRKTNPPTFSKSTLDSLWFLKNMGDCGAHNYKITPEEAILVVYASITVCKQLYEYC